MKVLLWVAFGLVALFWTGAALITVELTQWAGQALASGQAESLGTAVAQWPVPPWIQLWLDPAAVETMQTTLVWAMDALRDLMPVIGSAMGWLAPAVWFFWGLGLLTMLALTCGAHVLVSRLQSRTPEPA